LRGNTASFVFSLPAARRLDANSLRQSATSCKHALEVLGDPKVRSARAMFAFFDRKGPAGWRDTFETDEAVQIGLLVEREFCK
jgi:hypothetical protein